MPLHRHLRHSTSAAAIPPRRLPSPSVLPATPSPGNHSSPFVTNDIPSFNPTVAASAPRDILEHNDKGILPPHDPSHTTPFSTFSHPSIPDTAPSSHGHIERPTIPPVHASSPSPASLSALPTPRVDLRATTTPAYCIMNEDIDGTTEEAEADAPREPTSIPIDLPSNISTPISPVGYAPPSPSPAPAPRTMSRRFFTQLLEETRRRSRCTSQPSHPSSSPSTTTTNLPPSPTLSTIVVSPPPRKSSLRPSVSAYPLGATNTNTSTEDIDGCITETLYQLEQLAERVRLSSHSTSVLLALPSPTRTGFLKRSASVESLVDVCMRTPTPSPIPTPIPTRGHHGVEVVRVPQIVVTLPSSEDVPSSDSDTSSDISSSSPTIGSDSGSGSEEGSVPEDVRWIAEYGRWSSASRSSCSGEGSSTSSQESEGEDDNDSEESDVSSLFVDGDGGDDGEGEGDTDTLCTSPPTSPRGCDKGRRFMTEFELRSSSDTQAQGEGQGLTFSLRRPPSQLFRRPRVSVIRPSKSLVFQARTEMGQRAQRLPPFKLPQARSSPHKDLPSLPLSYSHSSHPSPFTLPDLGSCHHQQHDLLRESVLPAQSQSCWSISTDGHGGPGKGGRGGWTKGLKRLFGRAR